MAQGARLGREAAPLKLVGAGPVDDEVPAAEPVEAALDALPLLELDTVTPNPEVDAPEVPELAGTVRVADPALRCVLEHGMELAGLNDYSRRGG